MYKGSRNTETGTKVNQIGSSITAGTDVTMTAGNDANIVASDVVANNNVNITAGNNVNVVSKAEVEDATKTDSSVEQRLTASVGNSILQTIKGVQDAYNGTVKSATNKDTSGGAKVANVAGGAVNLVTNANRASRVAERAAQSAASAGTFGFTAALTTTTKESGQTTETNTATQRGSQIVAGNNVAITAQNGANIKGSDIVAQTGDLTLTGKTINIESTENTAKTKTNSHETSLTTTLAHSTGILNAPTLSGQNGHSTRTDVTNRHATLTADNGTLKINSTNDTTIKGAVAQAKNVDIQTGGNLTVQSVQDTTDVDNRSRDISIGDTTGYGASDGNIKKRWTNVITKIIGTESVKVKTDKTLTLEGAMIANQKADGTDGGNLEVTADTLVAKAITDTHTESSTGHGFTRHGADPDKGILPTDGNSSRIVANTGGIEREQKTEATIGEGEIHASKTNGTANRDIAQVQEITKDRKTGGLGIDTTVEDAFVSDPGQYIENTVEGAIKFPGNVAKVAGDALEGAEKLAQNPVKYGNRAVEDAVDLAGSVGKSTAQVQFEGLEKGARRNQADIDDVEKQMVAKYGELTNEVPAEVVEGGPKVAMGFGGPNAVKAVKELETNYDALPERDKEMVQSALEFSDLVSVGATGAIRKVGTKGPKVVKKASEIAKNTNKLDKVKKLGDNAVKKALDIIKPTSEKDKVTTVGRWMSKEEHSSMLKTGKVQESFSGTTHVANPAKPTSFLKQAMSGSQYVEFDVPERVLKKTNQGWAKIIGPNSIEARLAKKKGLPIPEMPKATNIIQKAEKL